MDPKMKTALAVVVGIVIGATLLGGAIAVPAAFHAIAFRTGVSESGYGMMGPRSRSFDGPGMMGPQGGGRQYAPQDGNELCPNGGQGMMGPQGRGGQCAPQGGTGICPNGETCPNVPTEPTTQS